MAKKELGNALNNSVMGFINTPQTEQNKEEVKAVAPMQKKKTTTQPKKKASKPMTQTTVIKDKKEVQPPVDASLVVYSLDQAAAAIHVSKRTLFNYIKAGIFPAVKVGKSWLITEEKLREFVEQGTAE